MSHIISLGKQLPGLRAGIIVLVVTVVSLGACVSPQGTPSTVTSVKPPSQPTSPLSPTKPPPPTDWPYRWLKGIPCQPPCWEGITPGQTTAAEAVEILGRSPLIATAEITSIPLLPTIGLVIWDWVDGEEGGEAVFNAQMPSNLVYLVHPSFPITFRLGDVIQAYGEPSHVIARSHREPHNSGVSYDLSILYRPQGFVLVGSAGLSKPTLSADTPVSVTFFAPDDEGLRAALGGAAAYPEWLVPWQGMKDFDYYCRDIAGKPCP